MVFGEAFELAGAQPVDAAVGSWISQGAGSQETHFDR
jgi:hypothetical protein